MKGVILGSGVLGLLAKEILGDGWTIVPFSRSRFYSFLPALADNFIIRDERIDHFIAHYGGKPAFLYKTSYSLGGHLLPWSSAVAGSWLSKVYGNDAPASGEELLRHRQSFSTYDTRVNLLYEVLQSKYQSQLKDAAANGKPIKIADHKVVFNNSVVEFDHLVSTIPLPVLGRLCDNQRLQNLQMQPLWYYHIKTNHLDFEGANQVLVVDQQFDFIKVSHIGADRYLFYFNRELGQPGPYFMLFLENFDLLDGTVIRDAMISGQTADVTSLKESNIHPVGMFGEWDWYQDLGSSILRLLKLQPSLL